MNMIATDAALLSLLVNLQPHSLTVAYFLPHSGSVSWNLYLLCASHQKIRRKLSRRHLERREVRGNPSSKERKSETINGVLT